LNLDGLPSASCIPDTQIDLLTYIGGKLAGLSDWKPISFGGAKSRLNVSCGLATGAIPSNTLRDTTNSLFTFNRWSLGFFVRSAHPHGCAPRNGT
jgi:hypothetical protein